MPARADRRGPRSSAGREAHEAFPAGSQEEGPEAARHTGAHTWTSPWADLSSADPGMSPGSGISASRDDPGAASGARLRSHAQYAAGFDPARAPPDDPENATQDDPVYALPDGPVPALPDDPLPAPADDPQPAPPDDPQPASADDRHRAE